MGKQAPSKSGWFGIVRSTSNGIERSGRIFVSHFCDAWLRWFANLPPNRKMVYTVFLIPLTIWTLSGYFGAAVALLSGLDAEPWIGGVKLTTLFGTGLYTQQIFPAYLLGIALIIVPIIIISYISMRIAPKAGFMRLRDDIEKAYITNSEAHDAEMSNLRSAFRAIHVKDGLHSFLIQFSRDNSERFRILEVGQTLRLICKRCHLFRSEGERESAMVLGVIDGKLRADDFTNDDAYHRLMLYFAHFDGQRNPHIQVTRIFSYGKDSQMCKRAVSALILNVISGVSTYLHVHKCKSCTTDSLCSDCESSIRIPLYGLDYVVIPRNRDCNPLRKTHGHGPEVTAAEESRVDPIVYLDFGSDGGVSLRDRVFVDIFKADIENRLRDGIDTDVYRLSESTFLDENPCDGRITSGLVGIAVAELRTFLQSAESCAVNDGTPEEDWDPMFRVWDTQLSEAGVPGSASDYSEKLREIGSDLLRKLEILWPSEQETVAMPSGAAVAGE